MFSAQSLLAGNGASVTCLRESREPITTLNLATYVTPLVVRNFWLCFLLAVLGHHTQENEISRLIQNASEISRLEQKFPRP